MKSKQTTVRSTTLDTEHDLEIVPQVTGISHTKVTSEGAVITINANGLPTDTASVTASYEGTNCEVLSTDPVNKKLVCRLPSGLTAPTGTSFVSGSGMRLQIFNTVMYDIPSIIADYKLADSKKKNILVNDTIISTPDIYDTHEDDSVVRSRQAYIFSGKFTAPRSGSYIFHSSSSYQSQVFIQTSGDSTDLSTMTLLTTINEGVSPRRPYSGRFDLNTAVSSAVTLTAGVSYSLQIFALSSDALYFHHSTGIRIPTGNTETYINTSG